MIIQSGEWTAAQELLVILARGLSSMIASPLAFGFEKEVSIADRVFNNPFRPSAHGPFVHTVRLLPTLQTAQAQIARWIEILPAEPDANAPKRAGEIGPKVAKGKTVEEGVERGSPQAAAIRPGSRDVAPPPQGSEREKIASRAQKLVEQVRGAIQTLSSSSYLEKPLSQPLRTALAKLKPLIDELIVALSETVLDVGPEGSPNPFKHQRSPSRTPDHRMAALHRVLPSPFAPEKKGESHIDKERTIPNERSESERPSLDRTTAPQNREKGSSPARGESGKAKTPHSPAASEAKGEERPSPVPNSDSSRPMLISWPEKKPPPPAPFERTVAPIAFPIGHPMPIAAAKKKKRKRYFFKDEEEDHRS